MRAEYAAHRDSLFTDWPVRPGWDPQATSLITAVLQDDHKAPDAFALQALGPGYDLRELAIRSYTAEAVGGTTLLEHRDLDTWFEAPFISRGTRYEELPRIRVPKVLADARIELDPILIQEEDLVDQAFHLDPDGLP